MRQSKKRHSTLKNNFLIKRNISEQQFILQFLQDLEPQVLLYKFRQVRAQAKNMAHNCSSEVSPE